VTKFVQYLAIGMAGALLSGLWLDSALAAEKRVALVVGNSNYKNVARLPNPEKDATAMGKLFRDAGFDTVIEANNVGNLEFKRAIRRFEDASQDAEIAVVYYAGHGIEVGGVNYLVPTDAKLASDRDAADEAISLNRVVESVDFAKRLRLIILDACRDNPLVATMKRLRRDTALRGITSGLSKVEPTSSDTLIAYAAKAGSTAEDGDGAHSPFTTALLDNLTIPGLDVRLAFGRVRDEVLKITSRRQEPFVYGSLGGGNISLVPAPVKPKAPEVSKVKTDYELVAQIGTKKAWEVFLSTYQTGFYADLAREQLAKLKVATLEPPAPPQPAKPTTDEVRAWDRVKDSSNKYAIEDFIKRHPNSPLAISAQHRLDILERAAKEREASARAEREAAKRAEQERRAKEAARIATQQRAEEEQRAKEVARLSALKSENERRAKEAKMATEADKKNSEQAARIAALQAEIYRRSQQLADSERQKVVLACKHEQDRLDDLNAAGNTAAVRDDIERLSQGLTCERLRPQVMASIDRITTAVLKGSAPQADTPLLVASAQRELTRLGCYSGDDDGDLDATTKVAIKKYQVEKGEPVAEVKVTQSFVDELGKQKLRVCTQAVVKSEPEPAQPKESRKKSRPERQQASRPRERERPRSRQEATSSRPHLGIGVGF
jgi:Caspase domain/Putative peptidoglycan binding domain